MDRESYLKKLRGKLRRLPAHELNAALVYYEEYFDEAGVENEQQVIQQLGSPSVVASQIMADFALKDLDATPASTKKNMTAIWLIILAILSAPLSLPLLAVAVALIISVGAVIFSFVIAIVAMVLSIFFGGIVALISGVLVLTEHWPTALLFIGIGLVVTGLGVLLFPIVTRLLKKIGMVCVEVLANLFHKMTKKHKGGL
ncbi:DUF1700 domain-containing protein [Lysinibacillus sphaericus]|uniref:Predicted membrane protein n=1 Tax=Lysinibacillus sphaericus TaxID=1421 RepID=A0A2S0K2G2_LYSSH|nr:DUF1700 domain-containing protein [Lysinibacillus sphaericus]AVK97563.1 hypothetical protein LS41612_15425 [Lysinibacillus sphaericus]MED4545571.1 DUF1700 domain-containing protein [Lysinibacillus sphaericus]TKI17765.1 DUF1700 domain-containing protein [Lysinibacillus sphaericus]SUV16524.1 Predicted membrane protein [Lysinibacillus sphaericus]GEC82410.1 hypothetical protein LSP03_21530 [Lysinibacillus sphaericus]